MKLYEETCSTCRKTILVPYKTKRALKQAREQGTNPGVYCDYDCARGRTRNCCKTCQSWHWWKRYEQRICGRRASRYFGISTLAEEKCECWVGINPIVIQLMKELEGGTNVKSMS